MKHCGVETSECLEGPADPIKSIEKDRIMCTIGGLGQHIGRCIGRHVDRGHLHMIRKIKYYIPYNWNIEVFCTQKSSWRDWKGSNFTKDVSIWFSVWYWGVLSNWGRRTTNWLGHWKGPVQFWMLLERHATCQTFMPKLTVQVPKIWETSLPR